MKTNRSMFNYPSSVLLFLASGLALVASETEKVELLNLGAPIPVNIQSEILNEDGMVFSYYSLSGSGFSAQWYGSSSQWAKNSGISYPVSLSLQERTLGSLKMNLFVYAPNPSVQGLEDEVVKRYAATVMAQYKSPSVVTYLNPESALPPVGSVPFFHNTFRVFEFSSVSNPSPEAAVYKDIDHLTVTADGHVVVLRFSGPAAVIDSFRSRIPGQLVNFK